MGNCCIPGCENCADAKRKKKNKQAKENEDSENVGANVVKKRPSFHRFPSPKTEPEAFSSWVAAIPRVQATTVEDYINLRVCSEHFLPEELEYRILLPKVDPNDPNERPVYRITKVPHLRPGAVPSQFPNCPSYLSTDPGKIRGAAQRNARAQRRSLSTIDSNASITSTVDTGMTTTDGHRITTFTNDGTTISDPADTTVTTTTATTTDGHGCTTLTNNSTANSNALTISDVHAWLVTATPSGWQLVGANGRIMLLQLTTSPVPFLRRSVLVSEDLSCTTYVYDESRMDLSTGASAVTVHSHCHGKLSEVSQLSAIISALRDARVETVDLTAPGVESGSVGIDKVRS